MDCYYTNESYYPKVEETIKFFSAREHKLQWGMNVISSSEYGMSSVQMEKNLQELVTLGGTTAVFVSVHYQESTFSSKIYPKQSSPSVQSLKSAISFAKRLGLKVSLKPHVNLETRESRNRINPANFSEWSTNYSEYILSYAYLASELKVDSFFIGTELEGTTNNDEYWRSLIKLVRKVYKGEVSYSSNRLSEAENINWWDSLDFIGVSFYEPVLTVVDNDTTEAELISAWYYNGYILRLLQLHERWKKNIILSELGYYGRYDTALNPAVISNGRIDSRAQAIAYGAAYRVLSKVPQVKAFYIWALDASSISQPGGFSIIPTNNAVMCELKSNKN